MKDEVDKRLHLIHLVRYEAIVEQHQRCTSSSACLFPSSMALMRSTLSTESPSSLSSSSIKLEGSSPCSNRARAASSTDCARPPTVSRLPNVVMVILLIEAPRGVVVRMAYANGASGRILFEEQHLVGRTV